MTFPRRATVLVAVASAFVAGCGDDAPTDFSATTTNDFFAACTDATADSLLHTRLCQCVIDELTSDLEYATFVELSDAMAVEPAPPTAPEIVDVVADCVIEVGDL